MIFSLSVIDETQVVPEAGAIRENPKSFSIAPAVNTRVSRKKIIWKHLNVIVYSTTPTPYHFVVLNILFPLLPLNLVKLN